MLFGSPASGLFSGESAGATTTVVSLAYVPDSDDKYYTGQNMISDMAINRKGESDNLLRIHPFYLGAESTLKDVAIHTYQVGDSQHVRWGIWQSDGLNGMAGTLLFDSGKQACYAATGWYAVADTTVLAAGKYWFGTLSTTTGTPANYWGAGGKSPLEGMSATTGDKLAINYHQGFQESANTFSIDSALVNVDTEVFIPDQQSTRDGQIAVFARFTP